MRAPTPRRASERARRGIRSRNRTRRGRRTWSLARSRATPQAARSRRRAPHEPHRATAPWRRRIARLSRRAGGRWSFLRDREMRRLPMTDPRPRWLTVWLMLAVALSTRAHAAGPLGPQGSPITTSRYGIDLYQGPVLASARVTGLSGAVTAVGEGADAIPWNPAAVALRAPYSTTRADWEVTGGL